MVWRSICFVGILLICAGAVSCRKVDSVNPTRKVEERIATLEKTSDILEEENEVIVSGESDSFGDTENEAEVKEEETGDMDMNEALTEETIAHNGILLSEAIRIEEAESLQGSLQKYPAGTIIDTSGFENVVLERLFYFTEITDGIKARILGKSYGEKCDVPYSELCYVRVLYRGFDGLTHIGELIVSNTIAEDSIEIFKELYEMDYPIERMVLVDEYNADDIASMEANNSSAFNYRVIEGTSKLSLHSLGQAIDINPLYNPYVREIDGKTVVLPENGTIYADRSKECPYYIKEGDPCYLAFTKRGFTWGGEWKSQKDYQHFQKKPIQ